MRCDAATKTTTVSNLQIRFKSSTRKREVNEYATRIDVTITCLGKRGIERLIGKVRLFYLDLAALFDANDNLHDLFDCCPETAPFYSVLIDHETGDFKPNLEEVLGEYICDMNILIIDRLEILPEFRGKKIGLASLIWCLRQYARQCGVVALKCFPLQFECADIGDPGWRQDMQYGKLSRDTKRSLAKLKKYYGSLGFKGLSGDDIMVAFGG
jgi:hypothetical protein